MNTALNVAQSGVDFVKANWLFLIVAVIGLTALAKLSAMRKNDKPVREAKKQVKRQQRVAQRNRDELINSGNRILGLLDQHIQVDFTPVLTSLRTSYQVLVNELTRNEELTLEPSSLIQEYLNYYPNDLSSQLYLEMNHFKDLYYESI